MPGLTELLNLILALDSADRQKEQLAISRQDLALRSQRQDSELAQIPLANFSSFGDVLKHVDSPDQLGSVIDLYASHGLPRGALSAMAMAYRQDVAGQNAGVMHDFITHAKGGQVANYTPQYGDFASGVATSQGMGQGVGSAAAQRATQGVIEGNPQIANAAGMRGATGQTPSEFRWDQAASNMGADEIKHFLRIKYGADLNAGQMSEEDINKKAQTFQAMVHADQQKLETAKMIQQGELGFMDYATRGGSPDSQKAALEKSLQADVEFLSKNPTAAATAQITIQGIKEKYDKLHGMGSFEQSYGANPQMSPGFWQRFRW